MRLLLPAEKLFYNYLMDNMVQWKKIEIKTMKPPRGFESKTSINMAKRKLKLE